MKTSRAQKQNSKLLPLEGLIGEWAVEATHPAVPNTTLQGHHAFEWLEGGAFILLRQHIDDPRFPDGLAIIGSDDTTGQYYMIYFDERDVSRKYNVFLKDGAVSWERITPEFSQRMLLTLEDGGNLLIGRGRMKQGEGEWEDDIQLHCRRAG